MNQSTEMKEFFDSKAAHWDMHPEEHGIRDTITSMMDLPEGAVIADIGCGKGVMLGHLLRTNPSRILAIDLSAEMLEGAKALHTDSRIAFHNEDLFQMALPPLDAAILYNAYPHFLDKEALARKLAQSVKPGGIAVIAHGRSKEIINGGHAGGVVFRLSVTLRDAETEARCFAPWFIRDTCVDTEEFYFIRMIRAGD